MSNARWRARLYPWILAAIFTAVGTCSPLPAPDYPIVAMAHAGPRQPSDGGMEIHAGGPEDYSAPAHSGRPVIPGAHVLPLPRVQPIGIPPEDDGIVPGEPPSSAFPAGTVYLARSEENGPSVTEWDLARGKIRRTRRLDVAPNQRLMRIRRIGDVLHLVAWKFRADAQYLQLGLNLEPRLSWPLGTAGFDPAMAVFGDAGSTVLLSNTAPPDRDGSREIGYFAYLFDAGNRLLARRKISEFGPAAFSKFATMVDGRITVALATSERTALRIIRLGPSLQIEFDVTVRLPLADRGPGLVFSSLFVERDRFYVVTYRPHLQTAFNLFGQQIGPTSSCGTDDRLGLDDDHDLWFSGEHVVFHGPHRDEWIEWTSVGNEVAPTPPCLAP